MAIMAKQHSNRVREQRLARGLSQADLAVQSGLSRPAVSAIEIGRLVPSVAAALALARVFGCSVEELFGSGSRTNPQFNRDTLPGSLAPYHIDYRHLESLGGLRGKSKTVAPEVNGFWQNDSFHHYADYTLSAEFRPGLEELITLSQATPSAIMCSEAVWWRCHRRIVADHLIARGESVFHLMGHDRIEAARLTEGAHLLPSGRVDYPRPAPPESAPDLR